MFLSLSRDSFMFYLCQGILFYILVSVKRLLSFILSFLSRDPFCVVISVKDSFCVFISVRELLSFILSFLSRDHFYIFSCLKCIVT